MQVIKDVTDDSVQIVAISENANDRFFLVIKVR